MVFSLQLPYPDLVHFPNRNSCYVNKRGGFLCELRYFPQTEDLPGAIAHTKNGLTILRDMTGPLWPNILEKLRRRRTERYTH